MGWMQTFLHVDKGKSLGESTDRNMTVNYPVKLKLAKTKLFYFIDFIFNYRN